MLLKALPACPYIDALAAELLRIAPAVPVVFRCPLWWSLFFCDIRAHCWCTHTMTIPRKASQDLQVGPFTAPAGWNVWPHLGDAVLRYNNDEFNPERWLDGGPRAGPPRASSCPFEFSQPFGAGTRTCLGKPFMMLQVKVALAVLCSGYRWKLPEQAPQWTVVPTPRYKEPVVVLFARNDG